MRKRKGKGAGSSRGRQDDRRERIKEGTSEDIGWEDITQRNVRARLVASSLQDGRKERIQTEKYRCNAL